MKKFFKTTFACVLGVFIASGLMFIIMMVSLIGIASSGESEYIPSKNTVFSLKLNTAVAERGDNNPLSELMNMVNEEEGKLSLATILESIDKAKENENISGIYLNTDGYSAGYATTEAIRNKLSEFKESGKFIVAYNETFGQKQYYLSSVADSIYVNPYGTVELSGLATKGLFYKKALEKLGVEMQIFRVGTFKSAVEPFMLDKMSDANKEQVSVYLNSVWSTILDGISQSRGLSKDELNKLANDGIAFEDGKDIVETGLITGALYKSQMEDVLKSMLGTDKVKAATLKNISSIKSSKSEPKDKIAVLYADGEIAGGKTKDGIYWIETIKSIDKIIEDKSVKGVVFRVNSPGGSAYASEQIWEAIERLKAVKPVVVSMGDYAASGGYYISAGADYIFAEPTTLTGSIGVFGMVPNAEKLISDKIGLSVDGVKTNTFGQMTIFEPLSSVEKVKIQKSVERVYDLFKTRCADGRGLSKDSIGVIAEGRVWTGENALNIGLVDELGGIEQAKAKAAELAELDTYGTVVYPKKKEFLEAFMEELSNEGTINIKQKIMGDDYQYIKFLDYIRNMDKIQARMEFMEIN